MKYDRYKKSKWTRRNYSIYASMKHIYLFVCCLLYADKWQHIVCHTHYFLLLCIRPPNTNTFKPCHLDGRWSLFCLIIFAYDILMDMQLLFKINNAMEDTSFGLNGSWNQTSWDTKIENWLLILIHKCIHQCYKWWGRSVYSVCVCTLNRKLFLVEIGSQRFQFEVHLFNGKKNNLFLLIRIGAAKSMFNLYSNNKMKFIAEIVKFW